MNATRGDGFLEGFLAQRRINLANSLIIEPARKGRILDMGCGTTPYFLMSTQFHEKHGLDKIQETGVIELQGEKIFMQHYDIETENKLPYGDTYFDVVTMLAVFEHIEPARLVVLLREVYRVMKPGGQYLLTTPAAWAAILLGILAGFGLVSREEIDEHKTKYTHDKILGLLAKAGFSATNSHYGYFEAFMNLWVSASK